MGKGQTSLREMLANPWVNSIVILRVLAALLLFFTPLWGTVLVLGLDWLDAYFIIQKGGFTRVEYHALDKRVDWVSQIVMFIIGSYSGYGLLMFLCVFYRFIGFLLHVNSKSTKAYVFFPNLIEPAFLAFIALPILPIGQTTTFFVLATLKELQEIMLHMYTPRRLSYLRSHGGYPKWMQALGVRNLN